MNTKTFRILLMVKFERWFGLVWLWCVIISDIAINQNNHSYMKIVFKISPSNRRRDRSQFGEQSNTSKSSVFHKTKNTIREFETIYDEIQLVLPNSYRCWNWIEYQEFVKLKINPGVVVVVMMMNKEQMVRLILDLHIFI